MRQSLLVLLLLVVGFIGGQTLQGPGIAWIVEKIRGGPAIETMEHPDAQGRGGSPGLPRRREMTEVSDRLSDQAPDDVLLEDEELESEGIPESPPVSLVEAAGQRRREARAARQAEDDSAKSKDEPPTQSVTSEPEPARSPGKKAGLFALLPPQARQHAKVAGEGGSDWERIEQQMSELGVCRYEVSGEPGQSIRIRCSVPVVGSEVVCQFEAEGEELATAAEAALRRVRIWRMTEEGSAAMSRSADDGGKGPVGLSAQVSR